MFINIDKPDDKKRVKEIWSSMRKDSELQFWIGNPSVDLISGILYFIPYVPVPKKEENLKLIQSNILTIVSIPNSMDVTELYSMFRGFKNDIQIMRVLKTTYTDHYAIIIKFNTVEAANDFYIKNNLAKFNLIEEDVCIIREIERVDMKREKIDLSPEIIPALIKERANSTDSASSDVFSLALESNSQDLKKEWQRMTAYENQYTCPICLEPIFEIPKQDRINTPVKKPVKSLENPSDIIDSLHVISILCGHFFHISCLEKWNDAKCPVCRYHQHPLESSKCDFCGASEALWMCIICGFIGCAPDGPTNGHIKDHYEATKHIYAVETDTKGVFDFSKNGFVQRLLQNIRDGKIIQHESGSNQEAKIFQNEELEKRLDTVIYEYNLLLSSQYQSQKEYYQEQLRQCSKEHEQKLRKQDEEIRQLQEEEKHEFKCFSTIEEEFEQRRQEFFILKETFTKLDNEKKELERINKSLTRKQQDLKDSHKTAEGIHSDELESLKQQTEAIATQIQDMEAHIRTKGKIQKALSKEGVDTDSAHILMSSKSGKGKKKK